VKTLTLMILLALSSIPLFSIVQVARAEEEINVDVVAQNFFCTCGCNLILSVCETQMTCDVAKRMKQEIQGMIDRGMGEEQITEEMISIYGNSVLAKPPMQGFTLALWWYPVIGGAVGVFMIFMISKRRSGVNWRIDPDESIELDEETLMERIELEDQSRLAVARRYEDLLKKKLEESKNR